ncbi:MAG: hypothetical protein M3179_04665, partial [Actinomycetota bacterium]|nr:hypothetical protein [Actinomycetota bacterium]
MIRRALRLMIRLALLVGAALVVSKVVQSRREEQAAPVPFGGDRRVPPPSPAAVKPPTQPAAVKPAVVERPAVVEPAPV